MALQVIVNEDGHKTVVYEAPLMKCNSLAAPSYKAVQDALDYLKLTATLEQRGALETLMAFIKTR